MPFLSIPGALVTLALRGCILDRIVAIAHLDSLQMSRIKAMGDNTDSIELDVEPLKTKVSCVEVTCPPPPDPDTQY